MSASNHAKRPIIVKRGHHEHEEHGGQWKVAYADFVTAMMAFFLIMWLLSVTTQSQRDAIARYFSTSSFFNLPAGTGVLSGGKSVMDGSDVTAEKMSRQPRQVVEVRKTDASQRQSPRDRIERQRFEAMKAELEQMMRQGVLKGLADHMQVEITAQGLRLQIFDRDGEAMFLSGDAQPTPRLSAILDVIAQVLGTVQNPVVITGHTDNQPLQRGVYSNWELSADRANSVRRALQSDGLAPDRFLIVEGRANTDPLLPASPADPRNRRIAVTILRTDVAAELREAGAQGADTARP